MEKIHDRNFRKEIRVNKIQRKKIPENELFLATVSIDPKFKLHMLVVSEICKRS